MLSHLRMELAVHCPRSCSRVTAEAAQTTCSNRLVGVIRLVMSPAAVPIGHECEADRIT